MRTLAFALGLILPLAGLAQSPPAPERWLPLQAENEWIHRVQSCHTSATTTCSPVYYLRQQVVGDTVLAGEPHALVTAERFDSTGTTLMEALTAMRVTAEPAVEVTLLEGEAEALEGAYGWSCGERPLPEDAGEIYDMPIGGITYALTISEAGVDCSSGSIDRYELASFALDVGIVGGWAAFHVFASSSTSTVGAELVFAKVDGVTYGANPVASEPPAEAPGAFRILTAYPNPFREAATVAFALPALEPVALAVFDARGRRVLTRDLGMLPAGPHQVVLDGPGLAPGLYLVRLVTASGQRATQRLVRVE